MRSHDNGATGLPLGRLPTRLSDGVRIPGVPFAGFILTGLLRRCMKCVVEASTRVF